MRRFNRVITGGMGARVPALPEIDRSISDYSTFHAHENLIRKRWDFRLYGRPWPLPALRLAVLTPFPQPFGQLVRQDPAHRTATLYSCNSLTITGLEQFTPYFRLRCVNSLNHYNTRIYGHFVAVKSVFPVSLRNRGFASSICRTAKAE